MNLLSFLHRVSTGKVVLAFIIPAIIVYFIMLLYTIPQVSAYAPGINLFDLSPTGYSFEYAIKLLDTLGSEGRELYLYGQLPLDFIYPGLFAVSCSLLLSWLLLTTQKTNSKIFTFVISLWRQGCLITSKIYLSLAFLPPIQTFQK